MSTVTLPDHDQTSETTQSTPVVYNGAPRSKRGEPTWEMTDFYPRQGEWTEREYLALDTNRLIEFTDGVLEFLPMPTFAHQDIVEYLHSLLKSYVRERRLGKVRFAPLRVNISERKWREPDIVYANHDQVKAANKKYPKGADLVVEVVSEGEDARERDLVEKPVDYAEAGIKEYWIVDPELMTVTVLTLDGKSYKTHGEFKPGSTATSVLFEAFSVEVDDIFAAAESDFDEPESDTVASESDKK